MEKRRELDGSRKHQESKKGSLAFKALPLLLASVGIGSIPFLPKCGGAPSLAHEGNEAPSRTVAHNHPDGPEIDDDGTGEDEFVFDDQTVQKQREFLKETIACIENRFEPDDETDFVDCELVQQDKFSEIACTAYSVSDDVDSAVTSISLYAGPIVYDNFDFNSIDDSESSLDALSMHKQENEIKYAMLSSRVGFFYDDPTGLVIQRSQVVSSPIDYYKDDLSEVTNETAGDVLCERGIQDLSFDSSDETAWNISEIMFAFKSGNAILSDLGIVQRTPINDFEIMRRLYGTTDVGSGEQVAFGALYYDEYSRRLVACEFANLEDGLSSSCVFTTPRNSANQINLSANFNLNGGGTTFNVFEDSSDFIDRLARGEN